MVNPADVKSVNVCNLEKFPTKFEIDIHKHNDTISNTKIVQIVVGEVMKERRRRERERLII